MAVKASKDYAAEIASLQKKVNDARNQTIDLDRLNSALSARADAAERDAASLREALEAAGWESAKKVGVLEDEVKDLKGKVSRYESEVRAMADEKSRADEAEAQIKAITAKYETEIASLRADLKALQVKVYEFRLAAEKIL